MNILLNKGEFISLLIVISMLVLAAMLMYKVIRIRKVRINEEVSSMIDSILGEYEALCTTEEYELIKLNVEKELYKNKKELKKKSFAERVEWLEQCIRKEILNKKILGSKMMELTYIGELYNRSIYIFQQLLLGGEIRNYCISASDDEYDKLVYEVTKLNRKEIYLYLKSRLLIEPFVENELEKAMKICTSKVKDSDIREYSIFME